MSKQLVTQVFRFKCDVCGREELGQERPAEWRNGVLHIHGCGMTDYTRREKIDVCEACPRDKHV